MLQKNIKKKRCVDSTHSASTSPLGEGAIDFISSSSPAPAPVRLLIIAPNWIGDMLMAQPLLTALKARLSKSGVRPLITVMAPQWVAPVLAYMPEVDKVISTQFAHGVLQGLERWRLARQLRGQFDRCYILPNSWKSAILPWLARIPKRIGYLGEMRYGLLTHYLPKPPKNPRPPMISYYAALAQLGLPLAFSEEADNEQLRKFTQTQAPALHIASDEIASVSHLFDISGDRPLLALCPGAEFGPAKRWPAAHFSQLAQQVLKEFPQAQIIALGSPKDKAIADEIGSDVRNLCGATTLAQAIALLARADAAVCNDSGLMHVTAALGRPQVALFGSSDPRHTPPHSALAVPLWLQLPCSPCHARVCPLGHLRCLVEITPEQVLPLIRPMLS